MDAAENVGILQFILKMAVTQAGQEVITSQAQHDRWVDETDAKMGPLLRGQADAMISQKALAQARAQLGESELDSKEKSKKVLLGMIAGAGKALVKQVYETWREVYRKEKREAEIGRNTQQRSMLHSNALPTTRLSNLKQ